MDQEEIPPMKWTGEAMANMEEINLREFNEERELFVIPNVNVPNMQMQSNECFYIDLCDDEEDMEDLDKEDEEEEISIWC